MNTSENISLSDSEADQPIAAGAEHSIIGEVKSPEPLLVTEEAPQDEINKDHVPPEGLRGLMRSAQLRRALELRSPRRKIRFGSEGARSRYNS